MFESGLFAFIIFIGIILALDISMIVSLIRKGDERREMIISKASTYTLSAVAGMLVLDILQMAITGKNTQSNTLVLLTVIAIIYFITLLFYRRKYGN